MEEHRLEGTIAETGLPIKLIRLEDSFKDDKNYANTALPYNIGFHESVGEIIIIQNPEVCHVGDILSYTEQNLGPHEYLSFTCANLSDPALNQDLHALLEEEYKRLHSHALQMITDMQKRYGNKLKVWYNHERYRPKALHFLTAIGRDDLERIGGFDEVYSDGYCFEDDDLILRIRRVDIKVRFVPFGKAPFGIHQWHPKFTNLRSDFDLKMSRNCRIYERIVDGSISSIH